MRRLTQREWEAIECALCASLASGVLDGFDDGNPQELAEERAMRKAMIHALGKVQERL